jgi:trk system potassium uptake protein TrkA
MRVVVFGAGTVGTWIADLLCQNRHSITVVDRDRAHTKRINDELDVRVVTGSASESSVLFQADVIGADLCLAVTGIDEVNLVAASMAKAMGARRAIARVYGRVFRDLSTFDYQRHFNIDRLLSLEHLSALELARGIRSPGSLAVENLAGGQLEVQELTIPRNSPIVGKKVRELKLSKDVRIGSLSRAEKMWIAGADDEIMVADGMTLIGRRGVVDEIRDRFQGQTSSAKSIVIAGGGETGYHLAECLSLAKHHVLLMDTDHERCEHIAARLPNITVVEADATRKHVLEEERVGSADAFAACIGDDESNIMAGVEAREIGAKHVMAVVSRPDYASVVGKLGIDVAVSPREVIAKQILGFLNKGPVVSRTSLGDGRIGVYEIEVTENVPITEHNLASLQLPPQCLIAAVMRGEHVSVPGAADRMQPGDTVIALVDDASSDAMFSMFGAKLR